MREQESNKSRIWGGVAVLIYLIGVVCAMLFIRFGLPPAPTTDDIEIEINFGVESIGQGEEDLASTDIAQPTPQPTTAPSEVIETPLVDESSEVEIPSAQTQVEETPAPPREVNQRALFPGRAPSSEAISQGLSQSEEIGNEGSVEGRSEGVEYTLTGRAIVGALPKPDYQDNSIGKVIIDVVVDQTGRVTGATYRAQGSTTNKSTLIEAARRAALKARFTESETLVQGGSITYIFKMD